MQCLVVIERLSCVQVLLTGVPLTAGMFLITGCQVTAMGVSWKQPWLPRSALLGQGASQQAGVKDQGGHPQVSTPPVLAT